MYLTSGPYHGLGPRNKHEVRFRLIQLTFGSVAKAAAACGVDQSLISHMIAGRRRSPRRAQFLVAEIRRKLGRRYANLW